MVIPIDLLESEEGHMYQITCAAIKRAYQLTVTGDEELEKSDGKVVSVALKQILTKKVQYRISE